MVVDFFQISKINSACTDNYIEITNKHYLLKKTYFIFRTFRSDAVLVRLDFTTGVLNWLLFQFKI